MKTKALTGALACLALIAPHAKAQNEVLAIRGGKIFTLAGPPIETGNVIITNGRITAVGASVAVPAGASVIDATGMQVYPGLFDAVTRLGLSEIGAVDVTNDMMELGDFNPHLLGATAVHPASEHIPVARANGITHAGAAPNARPGGIGGQASLVNLDGWTIEEMMVRPSVGIVLSWPSMRGGGRFGFGGGGGGGGGQSFREQQERYRENIKKIDTWITEARQYDRGVKAGTIQTRDLKLEAMAKVINGELPLLVDANDERSIRDAVEFSERNNVKIVLLGGDDAYKVAELLAEKKVPVIIGPTQSLPDDEISYDRRYAQPGQLYAAGVRFALSTYNASDSRTLPYEIGSAVSFGLPWEEAIRAVTRYPAEILGVGDQLGTIEAGKIANLIVTNGDPLEITTQIQHLIIAGHRTSVENKHHLLYEKYRARPKP